MNNENKVFHFTVAQLVEVLQSLPQELPVVVSGYESGFENLYRPKIETLIYQPENKYYEGEFQEAMKSDKEIFEAVVLQRVRRDD